VTSPVTAGTVPDKAGYSITGTLTTLDALWAKVQKWLRLALRKDAAVATDHATELSEINANGGSGAGAYDNTTDSEEALRDTAPMGTAMRGTDGAYTGTPPSASTIAGAVLDEAKGAHTGHIASIPTNPYTGTPPTTSDIKTAMEADGSKLDHIWEMTEDDGGVRRLTANALEEAPSGTGLTAQETRDAMKLAPSSGDPADGSVDAHLDDALTNIGALNNLSAADVNSEVVDALTVDVVADSIPADGSRPTIGQALYMLVQFMNERSVSGTTVTVKKADGGTTLYTLTLDDGTSPNSITRAT
jgi:hypothetical protein